MILQPNGAGGSNPSGAHFADPYPQFSSIVGGVSGCGGAGGSAAALASKPGYNMVRQYGGKNGAHRRGGNKRSGNKRSVKRTKRSVKRVGGMRALMGGPGMAAYRGGRRSKRVGGITLNNQPHGGRRSKRGGLSALSPTSFSGAANAPYNQFMSNQPASYVYGLGVNAPIAPSDSWMASPPPMNNIHNSCGTNNGLIPLIK